MEWYFNEPTEIIDPKKLYIELGYHHTVTKLERIKQLKQQLKNKLRLEKDQDDKNTIRLREIIRFDKIKLRKRYRI